MSTHSPRWSASIWIKLSTRVIALNVLFLVLLIATSFAPPDEIKRHILTAFGDETLVLEAASFREWHISDDCLVLQMIVNQNQSPLEKMAGPLVYHQEDWNNYCGILFNIVSTGEPSDDLPSFHYTRYWHGNVAAIAALSAALNISTVKDLLTIAFAGSVLVLLGMAWRAGGSASVLGITMALTFAAVWAMNFFSTSFVHGPASCVLVIGFATILCRKNICQAPDSLGLHCAAFGAVLAFMEYFSGLLPTAMAALFPLIYFLTETERQTPIDVRQRLGVAMRGTAAFVVGAAITIVIKQLLAITIIGPESIGAFVENLAYYTQDYESSNASRIAAAIKVGPDLVTRWGHVLTFGHKAAAKLLFLSALVSWGVATFWILIRPTANRIGALTACASGAAIIGVWMGLFPIHTFGHGWFMIRLMTVLIMLGWALFMVQVVEVHLDGWRQFRKQ